jgi:hypothetical protein
MKCLKDSFTITHFYNTFDTVCDNDVNTKETHGVPVFLRSTMYNVFEKVIYSDIIYIYVCALELIKEKLGHVTTIIVVVALYVQLKLEQAVSIY